MLLEDFSSSVVSDDFGVYESTQIKALRSELSHGFPVVVWRCCRLDRGVELETISYASWMPRLYITCQAFKLVEVSLQAAELTFTKAQND